MNNKAYDSITYDFNQSGCVQCIAVAKTEKAKKNLLNRNYFVLFSPENDGINCWVLCRDKSVVPLSSNEDGSKNN